MNAIWRRWRIAGAAALIVGGLWTATLAADELRSVCYSQSGQTSVEHAGPSPVQRCEALTGWTIQLASLQFAQYPPGYGEPSTH